MSKQNELPKASIIIPNKNHRELLQPCIESIFKLTTYTDFEIIIIENGSTDKDVLNYYDELRKNPKIRIIYYPFDQFNYQKAINFGVENAEGEYVLQLNNDTVLLTPNWLELMMEVAERENTGAVGAKLYYPDMSIQHYGGYLYLKHNKTKEYTEKDFVCEHLYRYLPKEKQEEIEALSKAQEVPFVTGACLLMKKSIYKQIGGMDENYRLALGDVDLCIKIKQLGKSIIIHPGVELIHDEGTTRGRETTEEELHEREYFVKKWKELWWIYIGSIQENSMKLADNGWLIKYITLCYDNAIWQYEYFQGQVAKIHNSKSWKIGYAITRFFRFFMPDKK